MPSCRANGVVALALHVRLLLCERGTPGQLMHMLFARELCTAVSEVASAVQVAVLVPSIGSTTPTRSNGKTVAVAKNLGYKK